MRTWRRAAEELERDEEWAVRQVEAVSEAIQHGLKERGHDPMGVEGERGGQWYLLDYESPAASCVSTAARSFIT